MFLRELAVGYSLFSLCLSFSFSVFFPLLLPSSSSSSGDTMARARERCVKQARKRPDCWSNNYAVEASFEGKKRNCPDSFSSSCPYVARMMPIDHMFCLLFFKWPMSACQKCTNRKRFLSSLCEQFARHLKKNECPQMKNKIADEKQYHARDARSSDIYKCDAAGHVAQRYMHSFGEPLPEHYA